MISLPSRIIVVRDKKIKQQNKTRNKETNKEINKQTITTASALLEVTNDGIIHRDDDVWNRRRYRHEGYQKKQQKTQRAQCAKKQESFRYCFSKIMVGVEYRGVTKWKQTEGKSFAMLNRFLGVVLVLVLVPASAYGVWSSNARVLRNRYLWYRSVKKDCLLWNQLRG